MKKEDEIVTEEGFVLRPCPRPTTEFVINIPNDVIETLEKIATARDMSVKALIRQYFGHGLRSDLAENFPELQRELFERRFRNRKNDKDGEVDIAA